MKILENLLAKVTIIVSAILSIVCFVLYTKAYLIFCGISVVFILVLILSSDTHDGLE